MIFVRPRDKSRVGAARWLGVVAAGLLALELGCAYQHRLVGHGGAQRMTATDSHTGLDMIVTTNAWDGDPIIAAEFTVIHVLISNLGPDRILLAPGDFELSDLRGFRFALYDLGGRFTLAGQAPAGVYDPGRAGKVRGLYDPYGDMASSALPWGVLEPGTSMRGYLFFEPVDRAAGWEFDFVWRAQDPAHRDLVEVHVPLQISRQRLTRR